MFMVDFVVGGLLSGLFVAVMIKVLDKIFKD